MHTPGAPGLAMVSTQHSGAELTSLVQPCSRLCSHSENATRSGLLSVLLSPESQGSAQRWAWGTFSVHWVMHERMSGRILLRHTFENISRCLPLLAVGFSLPLWSQHSFLMFSQPNSLPDPGASADLLCDLLLCKEFRRSNLQTAL